MRYVKSGCVFSFTQTPGLASDCVMNACACMGMHTCVLVCQNGACPISTNTSCRESRIFGASGLAVFQTSLLPVTVTLSEPTAAVCGVFVCVVEGNHSQHDSNHKVGPLSPMCRVGLAGDPLSVLNARVAEQWNETLKGRQSSQVPYGTRLPV
jgi:hypothetical protein